MNKSNPMYDPANPGLSIDLATGSDGKVTGLIFSKRRRHLTDGIHPDELEDRRQFWTQYRRENPTAREQIQKADNGGQHVTHCRVFPKNDEGQLPAGFYGPVYKQLKEGENE